MGGLRLASGRSAVRFGWSDVVGDARGVLVGRAAHAVGCPRLVWAVDVRDVLVNDSSDPSRRKRQDQARGLGGGGSPRSRMFLLALRRGCSGRWLRGSVARVVSRLR